MSPARQRSAPATPGRTKTSAAHEAGQARWKKLAGELAKAYEKLGGQAHEPGDAPRFEGYLVKAAELEPNNPYAGKPNLLDKLLGKSKTTTEEGETVDVPEPDPADKTAEDKARERAATTTATHKPVDQSLNAPTPPADPFHPSAPDSYKGMSNPSGNNANW